MAADTNTFLRVTATYDDEHGTGKTVSEVAPNVVTGPLLTGLTAVSDDSQADTARGLTPPSIRRRSTTASAAPAPTRWS